MWKILNNACPNDLNVEFLPPARLGVRAKLPVLRKGSKAKHQSTYDASFSVIGPKLWNVIPSNLTEITGFETFKSQLTDYLWTIPDKPPTTGYPSINGNSLLDWYKQKW